MAPVNRCVRCNCLIDDSNDSEEHIIQNSVGGRLTVQGSSAVRATTELERLGTRFLPKKPTF